MAESNHVIRPRDVLVQVLLGWNAVRDPGNIALPGCMCMGGDVNLIDVARCGIIFELIFWGNYFGKFTAFVRKRRKSDKIHCVVSSCVGLRKTMGPWERSRTLYDHYMKETDNARWSFHGFDQVAIILCLKIYLPRP